MVTFPAGDSLLGHLVKLQTVQVIDKFF